MAKPRVPIEGSLAEELYNHFTNFIDNEGAIPVERAFWRWLIAKGHYSSDELPEHTCHYQFIRLEMAGWIEIESLTRAISPNKDVEIRVNR